MFPMRGTGVLGHSTEFLQEVPVVAGRFGVVAEKHLSKR